jgi:hypothetical protein
MQAARIWWEFGFLSRQGFGFKDLNLKESAQKIAKIKRAKSIIMMPDITRKHQ